MVQAMYAAAGGTKRPCSMNAFSFSQPPYIPTKMGQNARRIRAPIAISRIGFAAFPRLLCSTWVAIIVIILLLAIGRVIVVRQHSPQQRQSVILDPSISFHRAGTVGDAA